MAAFGEASHQKVSFCCKTYLTCISAKPHWRNTGKPTTLYIPYSGREGPKDKREFVMTIFIGTKQYSNTDMTNRINADIKFLNAKILYVRGQRNPNPEILNVYETMLESRYSVLEWISNCESPEHAVAANH